MSEDTSRDEFRFVPGDAERVGRAAPLPRVERVDTEVSQGRRLSGLAFDPEQAPRIVTLHGAGLNAHSYDPTLLALDAPALSIDLPGHGRSDWRDDGDYRPDHLAVDIESALDALVPDVSQPFVLVGHSLGGLTASLVAASLQRQGKRRLSQLVIVDVTRGSRFRAPRIRSPSSSRAGATTAASPRSSIARSSSASDSTERR